MLSAQFHRSDPGHQRGGCRVLRRPPLGAAALGQLVQGKAGLRRADKPAGHHGVDPHHSAQIATQDASATDVTTITSHSAR
jgi:hypothetical protein